MHFWELHFSDEGAKPKGHKLAKSGLNWSPSSATKGSHLCRLTECLIPHAFEAVGCYTICHWLFYIIVPEVKYVLKLILNCIVWYSTRVCHCPDMVGTGRSITSDIEPNVASFSSITSMFSEFSILTSLSCFYYLSSCIVCLFQSRNYHGFQPCTFPVLDKWGFIDVFSKWHFQFNEWGISCVTLGRTLNLSRRYLLLV